MSTKVIRRKAHEIAPAILKCYTGAGPERIRYRVIYNARGYTKLCTSDFASKQDATSLMSWLELNGFTASLQTIISGGAQ